MFTSSTMVWLGALVLGAGVVGVRAEQQDLRAQGIVRVAMQTELDASRDDHFSLGI